MRVLAWIACVALVAGLLACGSSAGLDDAGSNPDGWQPGTDGSPGVDGGPGPDGDVGALVAVDCYELQIGVNTDDPLGEGLARWYGSLYPAEQDGVVTNVDVTSVELIADGVTRGFAAHDVVGQHPFSALPAIQKRVRGVIPLTAEELSTCQASGPELHRGVWAAADPVVRLCGTSDQGDWCAETTVDDEDMVRTCHTGVSGLSEGSVYAWDNAQPPPTFYTDVNLSVTVRTPFDFDPVQLTELVIRGEGSAQTYTLNDLTADSCAGNPPTCFALWHQLDGVFDDMLCPDWQTGFPPELYITYLGTANGQAFAGAAPAGQCMTGDP